MKKRSILTFAVGMGLCASANAQHSAKDYDVVRLEPRAAQSQAVPGEVIVKFKSADAAGIVRSAKGRFASARNKGVNSILRKIGAAEMEPLMPLTGSSVARKGARAINGKEVRDTDLSGLYCVKVSGQSASQAIEALKTLPEVEFAEPNYIVSVLETTPDNANDKEEGSGNSDNSGGTDPHFSQQWGLNATGIPQLCTKPLLPGSNRPVIAIIDTGVDISHPDLAANIWTNPAEANGSEGYDDDANGFTDDLHGWDFVNNSPRMRDNNGHGTHCAGIAAAVGGNGIGIIGANPDALIMPVAVMQSNGTGNIATLIKGIDYATANGANVISMSIGTYIHSIAQEQALAKAYQKAVIVAASGNDARCIEYPTCKPVAPAPMFPAAYTFVLGVQATDEQGGLAPFSNHDDTGPILSTYPEEQLYNYELRAPGTGIISTFPGGQYKVLAGTSMATPLVAGGISRLLSAKEFTSKEQLFGDLIWATAANTDFMSAYNIADADRLPSLQLVGWRIDDSAGDSDRRPDAGETIDIYPTLRNSWGTAANIRFSLRLADTEDPEIVELLGDAAGVEFGRTLSAYAKSEAPVPFRLKVNPSCADGRVIRLILSATCDNMASTLEQEIELRAENGVELRGVIGENTTLTPDKNYIVTNLLAIPAGVTLTIAPGTVIKMRDGAGISVADGGAIIAKGEPGKMIEIKPADQDQGNGSQFLFNGNSKFEYVKFSGFKAPKDTYLFMWRDMNNTKFKNCIFTDITHNWNWLTNGFAKVDRSNLLNIYYGSVRVDCMNSNIIGVSTTMNGDYAAEIGRMNNCNLFENNSCGLDYSASFITSTPEVFKMVAPSYFGSSNPDIVKSNIIDINHPSNKSFGQLDLSNMFTRPVYDAHGIVWKVVVDGYDVQDEYDAFPPLGVGRHKFEVYFNRPVNREKAPLIGMGVRPPYTQTSIVSEGSWRSEVYSAQNRRPTAKREGAEAFSFEEMGSQGDISNYSIYSYSGGEADLVITYKNLSDTCKIIISSSPDLFFPKNRHFLNAGEQTTVYPEVRLFGSETLQDITFQSSNPAVATVTNKGVVTACSNGTAVITAVCSVCDSTIYRYDTRSTTCNVIVSDEEMPRIELSKNRIHMESFNMVHLQAKVVGNFTDSVDVYTAYLDLTGKEDIDGVNRIYVGGAEDDEFFEIPVENTRFNVNVQSAGSLSAGFEGVARIGKIDLSWEKPEENFDNMLGYNMYRYTIDAEGRQSEHRQINPELLTKEKFTDFDVTPGITYYYYYKVMSTGLTENGASKVVAVTPKTAQKGDSNGSERVDVADVITTLSYMTGGNPQPFVFDAADVNSDAAVNVLDVVGTINIIMSPEAAPAESSLNSTALWSMSGGALAVDAPVDLGGVQLEVRGCEADMIEPLAPLKGFEVVKAPRADGSVMVLAYSMTGGRIEAGMNRLFNLPEGADVEEIVLADVRGANVLAVKGDLSGVDGAIVPLQLTRVHPNPFVSELNVDYSLTSEAESVELTVTDIMGRTVAARKLATAPGNHTWRWNASSVASGIYLVTLHINGQPVKTERVCKR